MKTITLEQLAKSLKGKLWIKGDLKRIYLDAGYNTKKMSTKTFVWQDEKGNFQVSCRIECPSQPWAWIKSQQDEIIDRVSREIENAQKLLNVTFINSRPADNKAVDVLVNYYGEEKWFAEEEFYEEFGTYPTWHFDELDQSDSADE